MPTQVTPHVLKDKAARLYEEDAKMNSWSCLVVFAIVVPLTAVTSEFLVETLDHIREVSKIKGEWYGVILLPIISFSAEALVILFRLIKRALFMPSRPPSMLAKTQTIDLSIQFVLFWIPFLVLLAWWQNKPLFLLLDRFEVALVVGAGSLVARITGDSTTNWAEGLVLICFYLVVAIASWSYDGEQDIQLMLYCQSVASVLNELGLENQ